MKTVTIRLISDHGLIMAVPCRRYRRSWLMASPRLATAREIAEAASAAARTVAEHTRWLRVDELDEAPPYNHYF